MNDNKILLIILFVLIIISIVGTIYFFNIIG